MVRKKSPEELEREKEAERFIQAREQQLAGIEKPTKSQRKQAASNVIAEQEGKSTTQVTVAQAAAAKEAERQKIVDILTTGQQPVTAPMETEITTEEPLKPLVPQRLRDILTGEDLQRYAEEQGGTVKAGTLPIGFGGIGGARQAAKIGSKVFGNSGRAAKAGVALRNSKKAKKAVSIIKDAGLFALSGKALGFQVFNRKVDEQQQGLNTLGQVTSSIVGDSTTGAGDWRAGLQELTYIRQAILDMEKDIKEGTIASAQLRRSGKIIDINADIYDQLSTVNEGIKDIQTFALRGEFPELSEFEIQEILRELEAEGIVKPVDLTEARR